MVNVKKYGEWPFSVAVVHGGPGMSGEMAPVALALSAYYGVLEPLQTVSSLEGQVEELKLVLIHNGALPMILVGHSWGAWLAFILAARYPELVKKLILVGSGPFKAEYAKQIMETRLKRLNDQDKLAAQALLDELNKAPLASPGALKKLGKLFFKTDSYNPFPEVTEAIQAQPDIYQKVWPEADELRNSGQLLELGKEISCPVVAIHGDYDPHPKDGVKVPLAAVVKDFKFINLAKCGHYPWMEKEARDKFYEILVKELGFIN